MDKWIRVKDELPKNGRDIVCLCWDNSVEKWYYYLWEKYNAGLETFDLETLLSPLSDIVAFVYLPSPEPFELTDADN